VLGVVAAEPVAPCCSVALGVVAVDGVVPDCPLMLELLELDASLPAGGCELGVVVLGVVVEVPVVEVPAVLWSLGGVAPEVVLEFGGTDAVPPALDSVVLRGAGTAPEFGLVLVWSAALPVPTVLDGVWLVTGGVVVDGVWVVLEGLWVLLALPCSGVVVEDAAPAVAAPAPVLPAACWFVQVSEITLMELTCSEPSDD
jgi:hypothetical protein